MALGKYELELQTAAESASDWSLPGLAALLQSLENLQKTMKMIASDLGFKGNSGDAAQQHFVAMQQSFQELHDNASDIEKAIQEANTVRKAQAEAALVSLPSTAIEPWVVAAVAVGAPFVFPGIVGPIAAAMAINTIQQHLDAQRETAAQTHVTVLGDTMNSMSIPPVSTVGIQVSPSVATTPTNGGSASVPWPASHVSGSVGGGGGNSGSTVPDLGLVGDGPITGGTLPGVDPGGSLSGGAATGGGLAGAGTGGLAAGAGGLAALAAASRFGGGGVGSLAGAGASSELGSGGLLGSSGRAAAAGAAVESEEDVAAKPGTSMMGSPGGSGSSNKEKRAGLGGFIAPKLEDEEEHGPRSAAALAGGRDTAPRD